MKTKNKVIALLEIAIVLCSVFLAAIPAIAADQNQTMQKMTASTITTVSEDDFVLGVYGNANEDDTIDMRDLTYVKLIFFGKKPETELADAKYDGKINPLDFIQIKLIIVGKEKEITIIDGNERAKTFKLPITRIIAIDDSQGEPLRVLGAEDKVVGVGTSLVTHDIILPEMSKLPIVGSFFKVDYEKVLSLKPDLFMTFALGYTPDAEEKLEPHGVQVLRLGCYIPTKIPEDIIKLGYLIGNVDKAKEFAGFYEGYLDIIKERTEELSEENKPRVFLWPYYTSSGDFGTCTKNTKEGDICTLAGGINIAHDLGDSKWPKVDPEWVIMQNPDCIIACAGGGMAVGFGYDLDDPTKMKEERERIMNRPELANANAVKNEKVYIISTDLTASGLQDIVAIAYQAKWFHPELFEDLDPEAIHQEHIDRFLRIYYDLDKHGVFVYPEPS